VRYQDLVKLRCAMDKVNPFVVTADYRPPLGEAPSDNLRRALATEPVQLSLI